MIIDRLYDSAARYQVDAIHMTRQVASEGLYIKERDVPESSVHIQGEGLQLQLDRTDQVSGHTIYLEGVAGTTASWQGIGRLLGGLHAYFFGQFNQLMISTTQQSTRVAIKSSSSAQLQHSTHGAE